MNRRFLRIQESRGPSQNEWLQCHFLGGKLSFLSKGSGGDKQAYSVFQIDKPHRHNQNPVGANGHSPLLLSTEMKTAISAIVKITNYLKKTMSEITIDETKLKELLKVAIIELMQEQKEEFSETLAETLEDILIKNAIKEGENTKAVSREQIFKILNQKI